METMLKAKELWGLVDGKDVKPSEHEVVTLSTYTKRKTRALNLIVQSLFES
jgi:hypothetical protein